MVSYWNKIVFCLKEFKEGMNFYRFVSIFFYSLVVCKILFVKGFIDDVDVNYLIGVFYF